MHRHNRTVEQLLAAAQQVCLAVRRRHHRQRPAGGAHQPLQRQLADAQAGQPGDPGRNGKPVRGGRPAGERVVGRGRIALRPGAPRLARRACGVRRACIADARLGVEAERGDGAGGGNGGARVRGVNGPDCETLDHDVHRAVREPLEERQQLAIAAAQLQAGWPLRVQLVHQRGLRRETTYGNACPAGQQLDAPQQECGFPGFAT